MDLNPHYDNLNRTVAFCLAIGGLLFAMVTAQIGGDGRYWLSVVPILSFVLTLIVYFHLRAQFWFWATLAPLVLVQVTLASLFAVPEIKVGAPLILMAMTIFDVILMMACIKFVGNRVCHSTPPPHCN